MSAAAPLAKKSPVKSAPSSSRTTLSDRASEACVIIRTSGGQDRPVFLWHPASETDQYAPKRSWILDSSAKAILYSDEIEADDSARSIWERSDTLRPVRRDICFKVRSFSLRRLRMVSPMTL